MTCGSGEVFDEVVEASLQAGLYGLENLSLIPGDVGASAVQNIGAYGVEAKDYIETIEAVEIATGQVVLYSHLFQNFPQFIVIHTVKGFGIVNKQK